MSTFKLKGIACVIFVMSVSITGICQVSTKREPGIDKSTHLYFDTSLIAIIPFDINRNYHELDDSSVTTTLTRADLEVIDSLSTLCFLNEKKRNKGFRFDSTGNHYRRQLVPVINSKREKEVYIKGFCATFGIDWKKTLIVSDDGGDCFFSFKINLVIKKYYDFMTGGIAKL